MEEKMRNSRALNKQIKEFTEINHIIRRQDISTNHIDWETEPRFEGPTGWHRLMEIQTPCLISDNIQLHSLLKTKQRVEWEIEPAIQNIGVGEVETVENIELAASNEKLREKVPRPVVPNVDTIKIVR